MDDGVGVTGYFPFLFLFSKDNMHHIHASKQKIAIGKTRPLLSVLGPLRVLFQRVSTSFHL